MHYNLYRSLILLSLFFAGSGLYAQRTDSLYMNASWQITEKPFANYYRFGKIMIDTFWFYTGRVLDYYMNDTLEMDGSYSGIGEKDGNFYFFYENGNPKARGIYEKNLRMGIWEYFYSDGKLQARVDYSDGINFSLIDYVDESGKVMAKDGTGSFDIYLSTIKGFGSYRVEGEFKNGKKTGTWKFYAMSPFSKKEDMLIKEIFENGEFKKGVLYNSYSGTILETYKKERYIYTIPEYDKLRATEYFTKDKTIFTHTKDDQDLVDYLVTRKAPEYDADAESFEKSYVNVIKTLNNYTVLKNFKDPNKLYQGEIVFNLSDSGDIEEVEVKGNLSEKEKEQMLYFVKKFTNIHEILVENVVIDAYHKIYFYTVIFADMMPKRYLYLFPEKMFLFSVIPYDKLKEAMKQRKGKKEKKN